MDKKLKTTKKEFMKIYRFFHLDKGLTKEEKYSLIKTWINDQPPRHLEIIILNLRVINLLMTIAGI